MYIPRTEQEKAEMLRVIGVEAFDDLLADLPEDLRLKRALDLPPPLSEFEAKTTLKNLASLSADPDEWTCFLGGGVYDHYIPSIVDHMSSRSEFYTAYTPYQPEVSQGTLQSVYEFQSLITRLTGMDIANASLYDGGTAIAEAALMAHAVNGRKHVIVSGCINPLRLAVLEAYLASSGFEISVTGRQGGATDPEEVRSLAGDDTCCVVLENPNFFGVVENPGPIGEIARTNGALFIVSADPISLGLLKAPSEYGADVVVGEGQSLGNSLSFGGSCLGFIATRTQYVRRLPGRIVGRTVDVDGNRCFCLTLQTREQHIRRERATSNICTNQALLALRATVYLCWLGKHGIAEVANLCFSKAVYAHKQLLAAGFSPRFTGPFFKEFVIKLPVDAATVVQRLAGHRIAPGIALGRFYENETDSLLIAFTEKRTKAEIDRLVLALKNAAGTGGRG
ncbi:MAG: aminomethyl-transferring glycine dehydrogenase subunit GcvPA [Candidatus Eisenbacteria bacterium]